MAREQRKATAEKVELRRDVTVWGSYTWGYADVGADIYVALGLVIGAAQGGAPLAFALAGLVYILIGLAFTELASAYPVAGGGHYYSLRGLGDFFGFLSGTALLLDYTIDIALFAVASTGYVNFFLPYVGINLADFVVALGPFTFNALWMGETVLLIVVLLVLNVRGIKESSWVNEVIGAVDLIMEMSIVAFGFILAWRPELLVQQWLHEFPTPDKFLYGFSLAIISFVGLESISQAAQETRRPATVIPRTSIALIFTVFILAVGFSTVGLGILPWQDFAAHEADPIAYLASHIPYLGVLAGPFAAFLGATILFISANTGVMGDSRLVFSMSHFRLASKWFGHVDPKRRTPKNAILSFGSVGIVLAVVAFLTGEFVLDTLANLYAFGATFGYILVYISLLWLRFKDPYTPRPYKIPLNWKWKRKDGTTVLIPILGTLGLLGVVSIFVAVLITHDIARIAGPAWLIIGVIYYAIFRKRNGLPVWGSVPHDWEKEQVEVLTNAEEYELLEQYKQALVKRDHQQGVPSRWEEEV